jgi:hypothetical protein
MEKKIYQQPLCCTIIIKGKLMNDTVSVDPNASGSQTGAEARRRHRRRQWDDEEEDEEW